MKIDGFTLNKIAGAVLGSLLLVMFLKEVTGFIYHADKPAKPGMIVEVADTHGADKKTADAPAKVSIADLLASADATKGEAFAKKKCKSCHTFNEGGKAGTGPNLWNIVGRKIASFDGFKYSASLSGMAEKDWSYDDLNAFLTKPKAFAPKTKMGFAGIKKDKDRGNVIAFLRSLSASPKPLPGK